MCQMVYPERDAFGHSRWFPSQEAGKSNAAVMPSLSI
jgi:hypothetical protein